MPKDETLVGWAVLPPITGGISRVGLMVEGGPSTDHCFSVGVLNRACVVGPSKATLRFAFEEDHLAKRVARNMADAVLFPPCGCCTESIKVCLDDMEGVSRDSYGDFQYPKILETDEGRVKIVTEYVAHVGVMTPSIIFYFKQTGRASLTPAVPAWAHDCGDPLR